MRIRKRAWALFLATGVACSSAAPPASTPAPETPTRGGTIVIGAEQEPDCLDLIGSCSGASWGYWTGLANTIPRAFDVIDGEYKPSPLLSEQPKLDTSPKQRVSYAIRADAKWSDGTPITSSDFKYTWSQIVNGDDVYSKLGYDRIEAVDDSDPRTAVAVFSKPYAPWRDLFSAFYGILPRHLLEGKKRSDETKDGFSWSGGPFKIESWRKGQDLTLVPNTAYWGRKPRVDKVVFTFITDQAAEIQAYKTGQVQLIYPQPQVGFDPAQIKTLPDTKFSINAGLTLEGLWFNTRKPPLDSKDVRQALAFGVDRQAVLDQLIKPIHPDAEVLQAFNARQTQDGKFYTPAFGRYQRDVKRTEQLMTGAGWTRGSDGVWTKGGKRAVVEISTTAGNKGRELVEQLLQSQLRQAGFELKINNTKAGTLFGEWLPKGIHMVGMYAQVLTPDPDFCVVFCSDQIPGPANGNAGQNYQFFADAAVDGPWMAQLQELDVTKRAALAIEGQRALAEAVPALPLYVKPQALVWSTRLGGPIRDNQTLGPFYNMSDWYLRK